MHLNFQNFKFFTMIMRFPDKTNFKTSMDNAILYWYKSNSFKSKTYTAFSVSHTLPVLYPELFWSWYTCLGSQTQTPKLSKVLISGLSFRHHSLLPSHNSNVLSLFRMQNSQNFLRLCPWTPPGRAYRAPQNTQLYNEFSPSYTRRKTSTPQKLLDTALITYTNYYYYYYYQLLMHQINY